MIKPTEEYHVFTDQSDMRANRKAWKFPLTKDLVYKGLYVDTPQPLTLIGYVPYMSFDDIYIDKEDLFKEELMHTEEWIKHEHLEDWDVFEVCKQWFLQKQQETARKLVIEVNGEKHIIRTAYLAEMQKANFSRDVVEE